MSTVQHCNLRSTVRRRRSSSLKGQASRRIVNGVEIRCLGTKGICADRVRKKVHMPIGSSFDEMWSTRYQNSDYNPLLIASVIETWSLIRCYAWDCCNDCANWQGDRVDDQVWHKKVSSHRAKIACNSRCSRLVMPNRDDVLLRYPLQVRVIAWEPSQLYVLPSFMSAQLIE